MKKDLSVFFFTKYLKSCLKNSKQLNIFSTVQTSRFAYTPSRFTPPLLGSINKNTNFVKNSINEVFDFAKTKPTNFSLITNEGAFYSKNTTHNMATFKSDMNTSSNKNNKLELWLSFQNLIIIKKKIRTLKNLESIFFVQPKKTITLFKDESPLKFNVNNNSSSALFINKIKKLNQKKSSIYELLLLRSLYKSVERKTKIITQFTTFDGKSIEDGKKERLDYSKIINNLNIKSRNINNFNSNTNSFPLFSNLNCLPNSLTSNLNKKQLLHSVTLAAPFSLENQRPLPDEKLKSNKEIEKNNKHIVSEKVLTMNFLKLFQNFYKNTIYLNLSNYNNKKCHFSEWQQKSNVLKLNSPILMSDYLIPFKFKFEQPNIQTLFSNNVSKLQQFRNKIDTECQSYRNEYMNSNQFSDKLFFSIQQIIQIRRTCLCT